MNTHAEHLAADNLTRILEMVRDIRRNRKEIDNHLERVAHLEKALLERAAVVRMLGNFDADWVRHKLTTDSADIADNGRKISPSIEEVEAVIKLLENKNGQP